MRDWSIEVVRLRTFLDALNKAIRKGDAEEIRKCQKATCKAYNIPLSDWYPSQCN